MAKYCFPALFSPEGDGYCVSFPDLEGCVTCADSLPEALYMAEDVLSLMLTDMEDTGAPIPTPCDLKHISHGDDEFVSLVYADTTAYRKRISKKSVKKTLTIPEWLNTAAETANINFSQTLQEALTAKLGLG